jgi:hypothetical protein
MVRAPIFLRYSIGRTARRTLSYRHSLRITLQGYSVSRYRTAQYSSHLFGSETSHTRNHGLQTCFKPQSFTREFRVPYNCVRNSSLQVKQHVNLKFSHNLCDESKFFMKPKLKFQSTVIPVYNHYRHLPRSALNNSPVMSPLLHIHGGMWPDGYSCLRQGAIQTSALA